MPVSDRTALESAAQFELGGRVVSAAAFGSGHINDTFALTVEKPASDAYVRFVLQRINPHVFPNPLAVMDNIVRVTRHLREKYAILPDAGRRVLTVVPAKDAKPCRFDEDGACWRCYRMIEGAGTIDAVREPAQARTASFAFARFARDLSDLPPPRLQETIPAFHDTPARLRALDAIANEDRLGRAASAAQELAEIDAMRHLAPLITDAFAAGLIPERITHNDTKINNVMLDDATGEAICVVDLDTVMPGLAPRHVRRLRRRVSGGIRRLPDRTGDQAHADRRSRHHVRARRAVSLRLPRRRPLFQDGAPRPQPRPRAHPDRPRPFPRKARGLTHVRHATFFYPKFCLSA